MKVGWVLFSWLNFFLLGGLKLLVAQNADSLIQLYKIPDLNSTPIKAIKTNNYYLVKRLTEKKWQKTDLTFKRELAGEWEIVQFSPTYEFRDNDFMQVIPANNNWKLSEGQKSLMIDNDDSKIRIRIGYNSAEFTLPNYLKDECFLERNFLDYHTADLQLKNAESIQKLLALPTIISIEKLQRNPTTEQPVQLLDRGLNKINSVQTRFPEISGRGTVVSIKEYLFDTSDIDLKNRYFLTPYGTRQIENHAGVMASLIGGSGNSSPFGKGVAWQTTLTSASFRDLMPEPEAYYSQNKIVLQNHSYGTGIENEYAADAAAYDALVWKQPNLLHIFSSGNSGLLSPLGGTYSGLAGWANLTGSFKMSKNSMVIGAADSFLQSMPQSSGGPAYDGRIKPELIAFGAEGSSGAAAITSGGALLIQELLTQQMGRKADAALVKALLINGADEIESPGPDFRSGYGNLNLENSLTIANQGVYQTGVLTEASGAWSIPVVVPPKTHRLRVTLVWTDSAASPLSNRALVNDLDLRLVGPDNQISYPWVLSHYPHPDSLKMAATRKPDHLNNVEQIDLMDPLAGTYVIQISPYQLSTENQTFALVFHLEEAGRLSFSYPLKNDFHQLGQPQLVRWKASFSPQTIGSLAYKETSSTIWQSITHNLPIGQEWFKWQPPVSIQFYQLRITTNSQQWISDTLLSIKNFQPKIGFRCADSILFLWHKQPEAVGYKLYTLGDTLMRYLKNTLDTVAILTYSQLPNRYVSVSAVYANEHEGAKSTALDFESSAMGCYLHNFLVDLLGDRVSLAWQFGTSYQMDRFQVEKFIKGQFIALAPFMANTQVRQTWDDNLLQGDNTYRMRIRLINGQEILSEPQTVFYAFNRPFLTFPNPLPKGKNLQVINNYADGDLSMEIIDVLGRKWGRFLLPNRENGISVSQLPSGNYLILFYDNQKKIGQSRLVIAGR